MEHRFNRKQCHTELATFIVRVHWHSQYHPFTEEPNLGLSLRGF